MVKPHIHWIEEKDATGDAAAAYAEYKAQAGREWVPDIVKCLSHRPDFLRQMLEFSESLHFTDGHLDRRTKELISTFVSGINRCPY